MLVSENNSHIVDLDELLISKYIGEKLFLAGSVYVLRLVNSAEILALYKDVIKEKVINQTAILERCVNYH